MSRVTNYSYTESGLLSKIEKGSESLEIIRPEDNIVITTEGSAINSSGHVISSNGQQVEFQSGENGMIKKVKDSNGNTQHIEFNKHMKPIRVWSDEFDLTMTYDDIGNLIRRKNEKQNVVETFEYEDGHLVKYKDGEGRFTIWEYGPSDLKKFVMYYERDEEGKLKKDQDGNNIQVRKLLERQFFDEDGQVVGVESTEQRDSTFRYDDDGNLIGRESGPLKESIETDEAGNVLKQLIGDDVKEFLYDSYNRPVAVKENGVATHYKYDEFKRLAEIQKSNNTSAFFTYNENDRMVEKTDVKGNKWRYGYDEKGNLTELIKPDNTKISYDYDQNGNLIKVEAGEEIIEHSYDQNNQLIRSINSVADIQRQFDITGSLVKESFAFANGQSKDVLYRYDRSGNHTQVGVEDHQVRYSYDKLGILNEVKSGPFEINLKNQTPLPGKYEHKNWKIEKEFLSGTESATKVTRGENIIFDSTFGFNEQGNCISKEVTNAESWVFGYNVKNELTSCSLTYHNNGRVHTRNYEYDDLGNRIRENNFDLIYDESQYQLLEDEKYNYTYDACGNMTSKINKSDGTTHHYMYDAFDRLTAYTRKDSSDTILLESSYQYDGLGRRIAKVVIDHINNEKSQDKKYIYQGKNLLAELDESYSLTRKYIGLPKGLDQLLGFIDDDRDYYFVKSKFNTVDQILDHSGMAVAIYTYGPFGELVYQTGNVTNDILYIGREYDRELGSYYLKARHYDPNTGRFYQLDPDAGILNNPRTILLKYSYGNNNPLRFFDPEGRSFWDDVGKFFRGVARGISQTFEAIGGLLKEVGRIFKGIGNAISNAWSDVTDFVDTFFDTIFGNIVGFVGGVIGGVVGLLIGEGFVNGFNAGYEFGYNVGAMLISIPVSIVTFFAGIPINTTANSLKLGGELLENSGDSLMKVY